jgi:hypothetical protein
MTQKSKPSSAALGFRVKSGWAVAALLTGTANAPELVNCRTILLSDPAVPKSKQPYHAALELPNKEVEAVTRQLCNVVSAAAEESVKELFEEASAVRCKVCGAGLVVGSLVDPATLHNDHMRAHGFEGRLFRTVLEDALRLRKIPCAVLVEKNAYEWAAPALKKTPAGAKREVAKLGETHEGYWRAEEKLAALAAWVALAKQRKVA